MSRVIMPNNVVIIVMYIQQKLTQIKQASPVVNWQRQTTNIFRNFLNEALQCRSVVIFLVSRHF